jgi:hypothetical protein
MHFAIPGVLSIDEPAEIGLHLVAGVLACVAGFSSGSYGRLAGLYARVFGVVYILLGALGFISPDLIPGVVHLDTGCNFTHLSLGLWGIWAGYFSEEPHAEPRVVAQASA